MSPVCDRPAFGMHPPDVAGAAGCVSRQPSLVGAPPNLMYDGIRDPSGQFIQMHVRCWGAEGVQGHDEEHVDVVPIDRGTRHRGP